MTDEQMKRWIWSRCEECGDCMLWTNAINNTGAPVMHIRGKKAVQSVRRVLAEAMGRRIKGFIVTTNCGNSRCLAEEHLTILTRKQLQQRSGQKLTANIARSAKLAAIAQAKAKLTKEDIATIRQEGLSAQQIRERWGISKGHAHKILRGDSWKDYSNPFAGLFAMNDSNSRRAA